MKILAFILLLSILLTFAGCGKDDPTESVSNDYCFDPDWTAEIPVEPDETALPDTDEAKTAPDDVLPTEIHAEPDSPPADTQPETAAPSEVPDDPAPAVTDNPEPAPVYRLSEEEYSAYLSFALQLFDDCADPETEENMMISPLSVITALGMTANGALGDTLAQTEDALGLDLAVLNSFSSSYLSSLPTGDGYKLTAANSIWYRLIDSLTVKPDFLTASREYFSAEVRGEAFDEATCEAMNKWVSDNTDVMINQLIDPAEGIPDNAVMYLINALAFDSLWKVEYKESAVRDGVFTTESGEQQKVEMMYSSESRYLRSDDALGFLKFYRDEKYAFVGLLPNEGIALDDYIASLTPEKLADILGTVYGDDVNARLPKFEAEYSVTLNDQLKSMGITDLFDMSVCDLSAMAESDDGNICVSRVMHKTYISVDEKGTKAAAVTAVEAVAEEAVSEPINIWLDRPFVYMIVEWENRLPIFMGTVESLDE